MFDSQTSINRLIKRFMNEQHVSQKALAADLGICQSAVSHRLSGITRWSLDDLDRLIQIGVPIGLDVFGAAINGEYAHKESK